MVRLADRSHKTGHHTGAIGRQILCRLAGLEMVFLHDFLDFFAGRLPHTRFIIHYTRNRASGHTCNLGNVINRHRQSSFLLGISYAAMQLFLYL